MASGECIHDVTGRATYALGTSCDSRFALSGGDDGSLRLWDIAAGNCLCEFKGNTKKPLAVAFTPDNRFILSATRDGTLRVWQPKSAICLSTFHFDGPASCAAFTPDANFLLCGGNGAVHLWEVDWKLDVH